MAIDNKNESQMEKKKKEFIQEQIVPERNNRMKKMLKTAVAVVFFAIIFGVVASYTISVALPYFEEVKDKNDGNDVSLEKGEAGTDGSETEDEDGVGTGEDESGSEVVELPDPVIVEKELTLERIEEAYDLIRKTVKQYNNAIVVVSGLMQGVDWFDNPSKMEEAAFGVILAEDAERLYILTSYDSVQNAESFQITFTDNTIIEAKLRGTDKETNLAVLSVAKRQLTDETLEKVLVAKLGDSYSLMEGTFVMALGSPNGYLYSMDMGVIAGQKRDYAVLDGKLELFHTTMGYYGAGEGVVVDIDGRVVGVITHAYDGENNSEINTMIGISRLKLIIEKMINKQPMVQFGIIANDIPESNQEKLGVENGIYVTEVRSNSPALETGIRAGDIIVEVDGTRVSSVINFGNILAKYEPGEVVPVKYVRSSSTNTAEREVTVTLGTR